MALFDVTSLLGIGAKMVGCILDISTVVNTLAGLTGQSSPEMTTLINQKARSEKRGITMSTELK